MNIYSYYLIYNSLGFPGGSDGKESACTVGDPGLIPGSGKSPGEGIGNPFQYSHLQNSMDRNYNLWGCKDLDTIERLNVRVCIYA